MCADTLHHGIPQDDEHHPDPLQHGPDERYAVGSHHGYGDTLQMACSALHIMRMDGTMGMAIPGTPPLVSPLPDWYHGIPTSSGWHAASQDEGPNRVLHTLYPWCAPAIRGADMLLMDGCRVPISPVS